LVLAHVVRGDNNVTPEFWAWVKETADHCDERVHVTLEAAE
jgi:hypothetical protein